MDGVSDSFSVNNQSAAKMCGLEKRTALVSNVSRHLSDATELAVIYCGHDDTWEMHLVQFGFWSFPWMSERLLRCEVMHGRVSRTALYTWVLSFGGVFYFVHMCMNTNARGAHFSLFSSFASFIGFVFLVKWTLSSERVRKVQHRWQVFPISIIFLEIFVFLQAVVCPWKKRRKTKSL